MTLEEAQAARCIAARCVAMHRRNKARLLREGHRNFDGTAEMFRDAIYHEECEGANCADRVSELNYIIKQLETAS